MPKYEPAAIEAKWQKIWAESDLYRTDQKPDQENYYCLTMFPYPSGDLHTGHWFAYTGPDIIARYKRMQGKNVLHPIGFDAFGLPAENAAIKRNIPPAKWTKQNVANMSQQLRNLGTMYDWDKMLNTSEPEYYRWTQWLFLLLYKNNLAYKAKGIQNWCPKDQTVLANEQVIIVNGKNVCERCETPVEKKELEQWFFKITDYAEELLADIDKLDWPEKVKLMQRNWIGKSQGAEITFKSVDKLEQVEVFTTRADTVFGATYMVLAPEHPLVDKISTSSQKQKVQSYIEQAARKSEQDRQAEDKAKAGVFTGYYVTNPMTAEEIPVWIADYVLMGYGTGAIMAVPAHDIRDYNFAIKYKLPVVQVIKPKGKMTGGVWTGEGELINSGDYNGKHSEDARKAIVKDLQTKGLGRPITKYRLRDWLVSRQRYWGAPIPIVYCEACGSVPVAEADLPVLLPEDVEFEPTGQSPLLKRDDFVNTTCPKCGGPAKREVDTMDTFVDSSWYYLRYPDPHYQKGAFDKEKVKQWLPVQHYLGGVEHAILHLLYSRFITKVLRDQKMLDFDEPFLKLSNQGVILGPDGQKMSKSRGNVVNPEEQVRAYGVDTFRAYLMFTGPWEDGGPFDTKGIAGVRRFLDRVWVFIEEYLQSTENTPEKIQSDKEQTSRLTTITHKSIKRISGDIERVSFNTAVAGFMEMLNELTRIKSTLPFSAATKEWRVAVETFVRLLAPFVPHITEELWQQLGHQTSVHKEDWPKWDEKFVIEKTTNLVIQVDGKLRANVEVESGLKQAELIKLAQAEPKLKAYLSDKKVVKTVVVPDKIVNFVMGKQ